jgi:hypothetical protein
MLAYILNSEGRPLMPCSYARARKLLDNGSVKVVRRTPFVIKFIYGTSGYSQDVTLSVDAGSKTIGAAAAANGKVVYASETTTRTDIPKKMKQRAAYRRTRRSRKCRYRPVRFFNRSRKEGWLTPTMRSKVQAHLREVVFVKSILLLLQKGAKMVLKRTFIILDSTSYIEMSTSAKSAQGKLKMFTCTCTI